MVVRLGESAEGRERERDRDRVVLASFVHALVVHLRSSTTSHYLPLPSITSRPSLLPPSYLPDLPTCTCTSLHTSLHTYTPTYQGSLPTSPYIMPGGGCLPNYRRQQIQSLDGNATMTRGDQVNAVRPEAWLILSACDLGTMHPCPSNHTLR